MAIVKNLDAGSQEQVALPDLLRALAETGVVETAAQAMLQTILEEEFGAGGSDIDLDEPLDSPGNDEARG
jgi:hypothetical protein